MNPLYDFLLSQSQFAHFYVFFLLILAGLCIPISEDLVIIAAAIISVLYHPEHRLILFIACLLGAYASDVICYTLGRKLGRRLLTQKPFSQLISKKHIQRMEKFYEKHDYLTLVVGRFIPFGVRNAVFITAGITRMNLALFLVVDGIACILSTTTLFTLGRIFAYNTEDLFELLSRFRYMVVVLALMALGGYLYYRQRRRKNLLLTTKSSDNSAPLS